MPGSLVGEPYEPARTDLRTTHAALAPTCPCPPVKARDLARPYPLVGTDDSAQDAARLLAREDVDVLLVQDTDGAVVGPLYDLDLLTALLPHYLVEDRALARVLGEGASDELWDRLAGRRVRDLMSVTPRRPAVDADAGLVEVAAEMLAARSALVAVVEGSRVLGGITSSHLLTQLLGSA